MGSRWSTVVRNTVHVQMRYTTSKTTKYVKNVIKYKERVGNVYGELKKYSKALKRE